MSSLLRDYQILSMSLDEIEQINVLKKFSIKYKMKSTSMNNLYIVVVGKNRTAMTYNVIQSLYEHCINCNVHIIHICDTSRKYHVESLQNAFKHRQDIKFLKTSHGLGSAMNMGLNLAFEESDIVLMIENDMLLHQDFDFTRLFKTLDKSNIGLLSFKFFNNNLSKCKV